MYVCVCVFVESRSPFQKSFSTVFQLIFLKQSFTNRLDWLPSLRILSSVSQY